MSRPASIWDLNSAGRRSQDSAENGREAGAISDAIIAFPPASILSQTLARFKLFIAKCLSFLLRHTKKILMNLKILRHLAVRSTAATQPGGVLTRPATRAHVGRSERRLARSRAHEAEQRDVEVRFSVRPCLPELGLAPVLSFHVRCLCLWNTRVRTRDMSRPAVPSPETHHGATIEW